MKRTLALLVATLVISGCGSDSNETESVTQEVGGESAAQTEPRREVRRADEVEEATPRRDTGDAERNIPRLEGTATEEGYGLTMIVDGSSPQAFQQSLEMIAEDTSEEQYRSLDSALRFLRVNSPQGWEGAASLYASLDGMTGEEIIEHAMQIRGASREQ